LRAALATVRRRTAEQIAYLERSLADIIEAAQLTSTDDEHDPEGATIAYERAQVSALLSQARSDLVALDAAAERVENGTITTCAECGSPIAMERLLALPTVRACMRCAAGGSHQPPAPPGRP
jgi:RNA polymerase-binding transcription factor DksA